MNADPQSMLQLRDIHLPAAAAFWPPAPGWWLLALVVLATLAWGGVFAWRRYRIAQHRRRVLSALATIESRLLRERSPEMLARLSVLLRRLALTRFPRERVATLSGNAWLEFLDESGGGGRFRDGPGQVLAAGPYQRALSAEFDPGPLAILVRDWVAKNSRV